MSRVTITSSIPLQIYEEAKKEGWKWQDLIICGVNAKKDFPGLSSRIKVLEAKYQDTIAELEHDNARLREKLYEFVKAGEKNV